MIVLEQLTVYFYSILLLAKIMELVPLEDIPFKLLSSSK